MDLGVSTGFLHLANSSLGLSSTFGIPSSFSGSLSLLLMSGAFLPGTIHRGSLGLRTDEMDLAPRAAALGSHRGRIIRAEACRQTWDCPWRRGD